MLDYYFNYFDLFFLLRFLIIKDQLIDLEGIIMKMKMDDGSAFDINETDLDSYPAVSEDSDEFRIFCESIHH
jgi:hypothetical protein